MSDRRRRIVCAYCERVHAVNQDGRVRRHESRVGRGDCPGSHTSEAGHRLGPDNDQRTIESIAIEPITDEQIRELREALLRESGNQFTSDTDTTGQALLDPNRYPQHLRADAKIMKDIARARCAEILAARCLWPYGLTTMD